MDEFQMGFLQLVLNCFHVLAWQIFALIYPLCASVRAIEMHSIYNMRKLITCWILFSFISLFDLAFNKLFEWFKLWPYIKMIAVLWLVIPRFTGAYYAYKCLVHPCLSLNLKVVINWFYTKSFLAELERYVKENGIEALEELIANKVKPGDGNLAWTKKNTVQEGGEENSLQEKTNSTEVKKELNCGIRKATTNSEAILNSTEVKKELNCGIRKATTNSEAILNIHLQGKKHWVKREELKASKHKTITTSSNESNQNIHLQGKKHWVKREELKASKHKTITTTSNESNQNIHLQGKKHWVKREELKASKHKTITTASNESNQNKGDPKKVELKEWNCSVCEVTTQSEIAFNSHLQGRKHKAKCKEIKDQTKCVFGDGQTLNGTPNKEANVGVIAKREQKRPIKENHYWYRCIYCNVWCPSVIAMNYHLNGSMHIQGLNKWYFSGGVMVVI